MPLSRVYGTLDFYHPLKNISDILQKFRKGPLGNYPLNEGSFHKGD